MNEFKLALIGCVFRLPMELSKMHSFFIHFFLFYLGSLGSLFQRVIGFRSVNITAEKYRPIQRLTRGLQGNHLFQLIIYHDQSFFA